MMFMAKIKTKFTVKDLGKTFKIEWCGFYNFVIVCHIDKENYLVKLYNINLSASAYVPNNFERIIKG